MSTYYRTSGAPAQAGTPAYRLPAPLLAGDPRVHVSLPTLPAAEGVTIPLECDRPAMDGLFMLLGILDVGGSFTDVVYTQQYGSFLNGLGQNTYSSGFWTAGAAAQAFANGARVKVVVRLYRWQQETKFALFINGVRQQLTYQNSQVSRGFGSEIVLGDTNGAPWNGTIYRADIYLRPLRDAVCRKL